MNQKSITVIAVSLAVVAAAVAAIVVSVNRSNAAKAYAEEKTAADSWAAAENELDRKIEVEKTKSRISSKEKKLQRLRNANR